MPFRIVDLNAAVTPPAGTELMEISSGGAGSFKIAMAVAAAARQPLSVTGTGTTPVGATTYGDVLVNVNGAVTIQLPAASNRTGVPVSIVDIGGFAGAHNILVLPFGSETIMGQSSISLGTSYGGITLWPLSTGGWYQK